MKAIEKDWKLCNRISAVYGVDITTDCARSLRRAELTLQRWAERECGDGSNWHIERDESTGVPYEHYHGEGRPMKPRRIADRERGALNRVAEICAAYGLHFYHQGGPRGCMLYVSNKPLTDTDYTNGVACC